MADDRIGWVLNREKFSSYHPFHDRFTVALENLTKAESAEVMLLLDKMQKAREPHVITGDALDERRRKFAS